MMNRRMFKSKRRSLSAQSIIWRRLLEIGKGNSTRHVHGLLVVTGLRTKTAGSKNIYRLQINLGINIIKLVPEFSARPPMLSFVFQHPGVTCNLRLSVYKKKQIQNCNCFEAR